MLSCLLKAAQDADFRLFVIDSAVCKPSVATFSSCKVSSAIRPLLGTASLMAVLGIRIVGGAASMSSISHKIHFRSTHSKSQQHQCSRDIRGSYVDLLHLVAKGCNAHDSPYTALGICFSSADKTIEAQRRICG